MENSKHTFAVFFENLGKYIQFGRKSAPFDLDDRSINRRITNILRLRSGDKLVFFDGTFQAQCIIVEINSRGSISFEVGAVKKTIPLQPDIILAPALLKKDSFEYVAYVAAQMGVTTLQPIITSKVQRHFGDEKELNRLQSIMVAACEQAKQFFIPKLEKPLLLELFLKKYKDISKKIYFDCDGRPLLESLCDVHEKKEKTLLLSFGPEGDITDIEKSLLKKSDFDFVSLTPTILRSREAVAVGLGSMRSSTRQEGIV